MAPKEKNTYFGYNEGHDHSLLRLGSLVFDFANPRTKRSYYHHEVTNLLDEPPMATADHRPHCSMSQRVNESYALGSGLEGVLDFEHSRGKETYRVVVGKNGSKVELIDPDKFFKENVLAEDGAQLWLETRLSVASKFRAWWQNAFQAPSIWLLTGVYLMEDAVTYTVSSRSSSNAASAMLPVPEPTGIAEMLGVAVGARFTVGRGFQAEATAHIEGRRVWAAQWTPVSVKYLYVTAGGWEVQKLANHLQLLDVEDMESVRSDARTLAEVSVGDASVSLGSSDVEHGGSGFDDAQWALFEESLDQLLEDLGEDTESSQ